MEPTLGPPLYKSICTYRPSVRSSDSSNIRKSFCRFVCCFGSTFFILFFITISSHFTLDFDLFCSLKIKASSSSMLLSILFICFISSFFFLLNFVATTLLFPVLLAVSKTIFFSFSTLTSPASLYLDVVSLVSNSPPITELL